MLRSAQDIEECTIGATDGAIGTVKDCYFDDETWVIRYLVVETGEWLSSRKVLISPIAVGHADWAKKILPVSITQEQVKGSPDIDTDKPVSRQHEQSFLAYYGYPYYWGGGGLWGGDAYPGMLYPGAEAGYEQAQSENAAAAAAAADRRHEEDDPHLRSVNIVMKYRIHATDGDIGHVEGLLVDEKSWAIRFMVVNTSNWWLGHHVLVAPEWIDDVRWSDSKVEVDLTREAIKDSPPYDAAVPLTHAQEAGIYRHYGLSAAHIDKTPGAANGAYLGR